MPWTATIDEQDRPLAGGGHDDAPFDLSTTFRLAEGLGQKAQGLLTAGDADLYSLGVLYKGTYTFSTAVSVWSALPGFGGAAAATLHLYRSSGERVAQSGSAASLSYDLAQPGSFFLGVVPITGAAASQYDLLYQRVAPPNQAVQASLSIVGVPVPGNVLSVAGSLSDGNGTSSSSLGYQWLSAGAVVGTAGSYTVRAEDSGRVIGVVLSFIDDAGYSESASPAALTGRVRSSNAPTVAVSADDLALKAGDSANLTFRLSAPSQDFTASDISVTGGTLGNFAGSGSVYTATFTPAANSTTAGSLFVNGGRFSNASGEFNEDGGDSDNRIAFAIDTEAPVSPKLVFDATLTVATPPRVRLETTLGSVDIVLEPKRAPASVSNMLAYVEDGFYGGTLFHRVVSGFVVQGGGYRPGPTYKEPTYDPIPLESSNGLSNVRGSVAMARTGDPNSATSQFYVNLVDNGRALDADGAQPPGYAVFGSVVSGMSVIDAMAAVAVGSAGGMQSVPTTNILITAATQSIAGLAQGRSASLALTDLEPGGTWQYSLDAGRSWRPGTGSTLVVPEGRYALGDILVRQIDASGNTSADTNRFGMELVVDDPATGQVRALAYTWRSHALLEGVRLETAVQAPVSTGSAGSALLNGGVGPALAVSASLQPTAAQLSADGAAVTLQDAVAILKMVSGRPANPGGAPLSPFQSLAADFDGNGQVSLADALGVLRHAVGREAPSPSWVFVDERDTVLAARLALEPGTPPPLQRGVDPAAVAPVHLGLVGVLRGDVDGSHPGMSGATALESAHPGYIGALIDELGVDPSRFGIYGGS